MTYYDPLGQRRLSSLQAAQQMGGAGQYMGMQGPQTLGGQGIGSYGRGATRAPYQAAPVPLGAGQQPYAQPQYMPQMAPQTSSAYGTSPAAQYIAATQAAAAQPGLAGGHGQGVPGAAPIPGGTPYGHHGAATYNPQTPYAQGQQPGATGAGAVPIPGMPGSPAPGTAHSYPGASGQYGYGHQGYLGEHFPSRHHHSRRKKKSTIRKIVEELLFGTAGIAASNHLSKDHRQSRAKTTSGLPPDQKPPKGSALGFLHPQGHFVPSALDYMVDHFIHGNKERNLAPEGAKPGYLHPGGHFVPVAMDALVAEFAHTLVDHHHRRHRSHSRGRSPLHKSAGVRGSSSSSESDYSDSEGSDYSSGSEEDYGRHGRTGSSRRAS